MGKNRGFYDRVRIVSKEPIIVKEDRKLHLSLAEGVHPGEEAEIVFLDLPTKIKIPIETEKWKTPQKELILRIPQELQAGSYWFQLMVGGLSFRSYLLQIKTE